MAVRSRRRPARLRQRGVYQSAGLAGKLSPIALTQLPTLLAIQHPRSNEQIPAYVHDPVGLIDRFRRNLATRTHPDERPESEPTAAAQSSPRGGPLLRAEDHRNGRSDVAEGLGP
jgi:hypothetical protein